MIIACDFELSQLCGAFYTCRTALCVASRSATLRELSSYSVMRDCQGSPQRYVLRVALTIEILTVIVGDGDIGQAHSASTSHCLHLGTRATTIVRVCTVCYDMPATGVCHRRVSCYANRYGHREQPFATIQRVEYLISNASMLIVFTLKGFYAY